MQRLIATSVLALALAGCGELSGAVFQMPKAAAIERFYHMGGAGDLMDLPMRYFRAASRNVERTGEGVTWTLNRKGDPVCRLTIHVKEESASSSVVWTEIEQVSAYDDNGLCEALDIAGRESVAAIIEGRGARRDWADRKIAALLE